MAIEIGVVLGRSHFQHDIGSIPQAGCIRQNLAAYGLIGAIGEASRRPGLGFYQHHKAQLLQLFGSVGGSGHPPLTVKNFLRNAHR